MKRAAILLLTLTLLTPTARADEDTREPAPRTASERTFILGEMRKFLASVQAITADLATGDTRAAATAHPRDAKNTQLRRPSERQ